MLLTSWALLKSCAVDLTTSFLGVCVVGGTLIQKYISLCTKELVGRSQ